MKIPPIYETARQSADVLTLLGDPTRLYGFGENDDIPAVMPYAVWQQISGRPENFLSGRPDADHYSMQIDVYADTAQEARDVADALCAALELHCYITSWRGQSRDIETESFRISFDVDWITSR